MTTNIELAPIPTDVQETIQFTLNQNQGAQEAVADVVKEGLRNVFYVGCGGSYTGHIPAAYLLETRATFPTYILNSDEFNTRKPAQLGKGSIVVVGSHTGTTKETIEAARMAKNAGAKVLSVSRKADSPLAEIADKAFSYESTTTVYAAKQVLGAQIAYAALEQTGHAGDHAASRKAMVALPEALLKTQQEGEELCARIAGELKNATNTYVLGAGPNWAGAYGLSMCYLMEMQWMHSAAFNTGEFFHGAFEIVTEDTPVILFQGEDQSRPMGERARVFLEKYSKSFYLIDSVNFSLPGVPAEQRGEVSAIATGTFTTRLAKHFEFARQHSLDTRRYMFKVAY
ncbi:MAG TPA: SIS domain-containing protein [Candidatus Nanopelagicaceae bacterium]|jgi:fructoselysine-6-P-deglycase FrlB-like protein